MRTKTVLSNAMFAKLGDAFSNVALPHTWNNLDGQDGGADYWRGIGIYNIDLPNPTEEKNSILKSRVQTMLQPCIVMDVNLERTEVDFLRFVMNLPMR